MEENWRSQTKADTLTILVKAVESRILSDQARNVIMQVFKQNYLLGPVRYSRDLVELIFPFIRIKQYQQSKIIEPFTQLLQFRRLLSGEVHQFVRKNNQKPYKRLKSLICSRESVKAFEKKHEVNFLESITQQWAVLENTETLYVTKNRSKILFMQLDEDSKQTLQTKFDQMRLFFQINYENLVRNKMEAERQLQYFQRDSKKYKQIINVTNKIYFINEGTVQIFMNNKNCSLELQKGSIIGAQKYFGLDCKQVYQVKSAKLNSFCIKMSNISKLGEEWMMFLQDYSKQQNKLRNKFVQNKQRQPSQSEKINRLLFIKTSYQQRKKTASSYQNDVRNILDKMYDLQEGIVLNHQISEDFRKQLPKLEKYTTLSWGFRKKSPTKKFNPFKCLQILNKSQNGLERKRRGFDYYVRIPEGSRTVTQNNSPRKYLNKQNFSQTIRPKFITKMPYKNMNLVFS